MDYADLHARSTLGMEETNVTRRVVMLPRGQVSVHEIRVSIRPSARCPFIKSIVSGIPNRRAESESRAAGALKTGRTIREATAKLLVIFNKELETPKQRNIETLGKIGSGSLAGAVGPMPGHSP